MTTHATITAGPRAGHEGFVLATRQGGRFLQVLIDTRTPVWVEASLCECTELDVDAEPEAEPVKPEPDPVLAERLQSRFRGVAGLKERAA